MTEREAIHELHTLAERLEGKVDATTISRIYGIHCPACDDSPRETRVGQTHTARLIGGAA